MTEENKIENEIEAFLSKGELMMFMGINEEIPIMGLFFPKTEFELFSNVSKHEMISKYFEGRNLKLTIIQMPTTYRASIIDRDTLSTININNVPFVGDSLRQFVNEVPIDRDFYFYIYGQTKDGTMPLMLPKNPNIKSPIIHGYSYTYNQ